MFHKQITVALLLSCVFVLGNSLRNCSEREREEQSKNLCSNLTFSIGCLCLENGDNTYKFTFQSNEICEGIREELSKQNVYIYYGINCNQLQAELNITQLEMVCQADGVIESTYKTETDLCVTVPASEPPCHNLECVTKFLPTNVCDNLTLVEEKFELLKRRNGTFTESQKYIVTFNETSRCRRIADKIRKGKFQKQKNATGILHNEDCTGDEKYLSTTLNLEGLKWVCGRKQLRRVIFEEKYINDSICRNVTEAERLFFPPDTEFETFTVVYNPRANTSDDCESLVDGLTNPTRPDISATIYNNDCTQSIPYFDAKLNYEALTLVCSYTDPSKAIVTQVTKITTATTEESTGGKISIFG